MSFLRSFQVITILLLTLSFLSCKEHDVSAVQEDFCSGIRKTTETDIATELRFMDTISPDMTGVYVLEEGDISMIARAWLTDHATSTIDIQYFIFSVDNVGLIACDYLVRAADRGVKIRILVDDIMVDAEERDIMVMDAHENIEIKIFNPNINIGKNLPTKLSRLVTDFKGINRRMHNKCFIADDQVAITGGRNIADEYFDYDHEYNFRDRDVLLMGKAVQDIRSSFNTFWSHELAVPVSQISKVDSTILTDPHKYERLHQYACNPDNYWPQIREKIRGLPESFKALRMSDHWVWTDSITYVSDIPQKNDRPDSWSGGSITLDTLIQLFNIASKSVDIQTPYLITTPEVRQLFKSAADRGVKVRILTNSLASTDNVEAFSGYQRDRKSLLSTGVRVFEYKPDARIRYKMMTGALQEKIGYTPVFGLHAKTMVIDGKITVIGTYNLDPRSAHLNTECITIIRSGQVCKNVLEIMNEEFQPENAWEITTDFNPDSVVPTLKKVKTFTRRLVPKKIL